MHEFVNMDDCLDGLKRHLLNLGFVQPSFQSASLFVQELLIKLRFKLNLLRIGESYCFSFI